MPVDEMWFPYVYVYSIGGLIFIFGMILAFRSGAMNTATGRGRLILAILIGGMLFFMGLHFFFQFVAPDLADSQINGDTGCRPTVAELFCSCARSVDDMNTSPLTQVIHYGEVGRWTL